MTAKQPIGGDDPDNARDHGGRRRGAHGGGTPPTLHAAQTAGQRHQGAKHHALAQAQPEVDEVDRLAGFVDVFHQGQVEEPGANQEPRQHAHQIGIHTEQGHHQHQRQHAG